MLSLGYMRPFHTAGVYVLHAAHAAVVTSVMSHVGLIIEKYDVIRKTGNT